MKKILVTGGTVFLSRYIAEYYVSKGDNVYVLNRNTRLQSQGVKLIEANRHHLQEKLKNMSFDVVIDVVAYNENDINDLLDGLGNFKQYIMISSSAVYPEYGSQPFKENSVLAKNKFWGKYGTDKIAAEKTLMQRVSDAYILRPPYLYGPMNNVYREAFVFDCAIDDRPFYLPKDGSMKLQFFHVKDLCRVIDFLIENKPAQHIFNVGNKEAITIKEWVEACYGVLNKKPKFINVYDNINQRKYFSFYDYEYYLDVTNQDTLISSTLSLEDGLKESYEWYIKNMDEVNKKPFIEFIDNNMFNKTNEL